MQLKLPFLLAMVLCFTSFAYIATGQGTAFIYQGKLADGASPAHGHYDLKFTLYDDLSGGNAISAPLTNNFVAVANGLFTTALDFGSGIFAGSPAWLEISVRTNGTADFMLLRPRQLLAPTPYAIYATTAGVAHIATNAISMPWAGLLDLPADFADGTDNDTRYSAGSGLKLTSSTFHVDFDGTGLAATVARSDHHHDPHYWNLSGNAGTTPGAQFLGTTDNQPLELKGNNQRILRLEPASTSPNIIGGFFANVVLGEAQGSAIAGGGSPNLPNTIAANFSSIGGGRNNTIEAGGLGFNTIAGGDANIIRTGAYSATIVGGAANTINPGAYRSAIGGGERNVVGADSYSTTIAGGWENSIGTKSVASTIAGGFRNSVHSNATSSAILGGRYSTVGTNAFFATIGGGYTNQVTAPLGTISGGSYNRVSGAGAFIGGGGYNGDSWLVPDMGNTASGMGAVIGGGTANNASGSRSSVLGGHSNLATNWYATVPGGFFNTAGGVDSFAAGTTAKALHDGAFIWGDYSSLNEFASTGPNQFLIRATGGVGILTNNPQSALHVVGAVTADAFVGSGAALTSVNGAALVPGSVSAASLADNSVTSAKISDRSLAADDLVRNTFWETRGNSGTRAGIHFLGTTDREPFELNVENQRALRLEPGVGGSPNVIAGSAWNAVSPEARGATISGGGAPNDGSSPISTSNRVNSSFAAISGGQGHAIERDADHATIGGGHHNTVNSRHATISGGQDNLVLERSPSSTIAGGANNRVYASADLATISGGDANFIFDQAQWSTIGGGYRNRIWTNSSQATIAGGGVNEIKPGSAFASISGGAQNIIADRSSSASIAGGQANTISVNAEAAAIAGGTRNYIQRPWGAIPGGFSNRVTGTFGFAAGQRAEAAHTGAFVWADSTDASFTSTASNQFLVRASGGVGIGTSNPQSALHVVGSVRANSFIGDGSGLTGIPTLNADLDFSGTVNFMSPYGVGIGTTSPYDALLDLEGNLRLNDYDLFLRGNNDRNHGLGWFGAGKLFSGLNIDGPVLYGWSGGALGTKDGGQKASLAWTRDMRAHIDPGNVNTGSLYQASLNFGASDSGEGIASKRNAGGNQHGLDFYTSSQPRLSIANNGKVGIGKTDPQASLDVSGSVHASGSLRLGSESGTTEVPQYPTGSEGLTVRRARSTQMTIGSVVARTDYLRLERDGTTAGLRITHTANPGRQTINCTGITQAGTQIFYRTALNNPGYAGIVTLFIDAQRVVHYDISFGNTYNAGHTCHVVLDRYDDGTTSDNFLVGTLTATYNQ